MHSMYGIKKVEGLNVEVRSLEKCYLHEKSIKYISCFLKIFMHNKLMMFTLHISYEMGINYPCMLQWFAVHMAILINNHQKMLGEIHSFDRMNQKFCS